MEVIIDKNELYCLIKDAVREVLYEERFEFLLKGMPFVSEEEMKDVENLYGKPSAKKEAAYSETIEI